MEFIMALHMRDQLIRAVSAHATGEIEKHKANVCLLYTSPSPRDRTRTRMPSSA